MRIKRNTPAPRGLNTIGKIKVGEKHPQKGYPMSLDYFRFTSPTKAYVDKAEELFGKTNELKVTFASDDDNNNCAQRLELRDGSGSLVAYTDLETIYLSQPSGFEAVTSDVIAKMGGIDSAIQRLEKKYGASFTEVLYLRVVLLGYPVMGQWELYTKGSKSSIEAIINAYDFCKENAGRVMGMPFRLTVAKVKSNRLIEVNGKKQARNYPVIALHTDLSPEMQEQILALGDQIRGLVTTSKIAALASGASDDSVKALSAPTKTQAAPADEADYITYEEA